MSSGDKRGHHADSGNDSGPSKRIRPQNHGYTSDQYTIGWVCALPLEMAAAKVMLDKVHPNPTEQDPADHNTYLLGEVWGHNIVVACLPAGIYGTTTAATVAKDMQRTFRSIRFGLMVGVGGGIPSESHDIRLGDVVVSQPTATSSGVIQYDRGKSLQEQGFERTGTLNAPPQVVLAALSRLQAEHFTEDTRITEFLIDLPQKMKKTFNYPGIPEDCLFLAEYPHNKDNPTCEQCDVTRTVEREDRDNTEPVIHYGTIASGNQVIKDAKLRDQLAEEFGALCCEMEAAGLHDFPSIVIRGICDYSDSHKNKKWQPYAAAVAAAFTKELLSFMPPSRVLQVDPIPQLVSIANETLNLSKHHLSISFETLGEQRRTNKILEDRPIDLHIVHEACYDSEDVGSSPRCEANTRVRIQDTIKQWANDEEGESFLWLIGPAGTGKSTLIRSVADSFHEDKRLVAGYFFKRGEQGRNDTNRLFSTLAIQLANAIPSFKDSLRVSVGDADKDSIDKKDLGFQFEKLIKAPIQDLPPLRPKQAPMIIVLDALDECERPENLPRALAFISEICNKPTTLGFRVLLTSRPDPRIINAFDTLTQDGVTRKLQLHRVFSDDTKDDIRLYLETNFIRIKNKANIQQDPWPSVVEVDHLVELSTRPEPLFIYAATLLRFVYDENHLQNPKNQLKIWIKQCENNESQLHQMYNPILEQIYALGKDTDFDQQLRFLGALVLTALPLSVTCLTSLLDLDIDDVNWWLPSLHAVLDIPPDSHKPLRLLHKSFGDFLLGEGKPGQDRFKSDAKEIHALLAHRCSEIMGRKLKRDICNLNKLDATPKDIDRDLIDRCIPFEIQYSCRYWVYHLRASGQVDCNKILAFLLQHFLHWLEVSALLGRTSDAIEALRDLTDLVKNSFESSSELVDFLNDAIRTISSFASIVESAPLQTYASLILFSPVASRVRQQFWNQRLPRHSDIEGVKSNWDAHVQTLAVSGRVYGLAFSPDGKFLVAADSEVRLFNASTGNHLMILDAARHPRDVVFSHNSQLLAASYPGSDATVKIWDTTTWKELRTIKTSVTATIVAFSSDDEVLALNLKHYTVQSDKASVELWCVRSGVLQKTINFHTEWASFAISPNLEQFAIYFSEDRVALWSHVADTVQQTFSIEGSFVDAMAFSPDGTLLAVECNGIISIWETATYSIKYKMENSEYSDRLCFCPNSQLLASICFHQGVGIWNLATGSCRNLRLTNTTAFAFSSDGQFLATASSDNGLTVWELAHLDTENYQSPSEVDTAYNRKLLFSPDGKLFASLAEWGVIQIWDSQTGKLVIRLEAGIAPYSIRFSPDSKHLASYHDGHRWIWDVVTGTKEPMLDWQRKRAGCPVSYSATSRLASVCWRDNELHLYDATSGSYLSLLQGHSAKVCSIAFSPHGNLLASSSLDGTIQLWDTKTRTCQRVIQHPGVVEHSSLKFSPDGKILAYHNGYLLDWWDIGTCLHQHTLGDEFLGPGQKRHSFSPNSLLLGVSLHSKGQIDEEIRLYDAKTARHQSTLVGHSRRTLEITFSPDSLKLAVASSDRKVRLWDTTTYMLLYIFDTCIDVPEMTRFSNDSSIIAVASKDKAIRLWRATASTFKFHQIICHDGGLIQELEVLPDKVIVNFLPDDLILKNLPDRLVVYLTDGKPDELWDSWSAHTFKLSNHSYTISADVQAAIPERVSSEVSLDLSGHWVMRGEDHIIYFPPEYRPVSPLENGNWVKRGCVLVYVCVSGMVIFIRIS